MNVPYNKSHTGSHVVQEWMDRYFGTKPHDCPCTDGLCKELPNNNDETDIYITSFRNIFFIEYQIKTLRKFFLAPHNIIIVDNNEYSNDKDSEELGKLCATENVFYIKPPHNHYQEEQHFDSTMKLGTSLSWIFNNLVKIRKPKYFGILDQDCFAFKPVDLRQYLDAKGMYGTVCRNDAKGAWNLHVTTNFFKYDFVKDIPLDFRASYQWQLDTSGGNFNHLFSKYKKEDYMLSHTGHRYFDHDIVSGIRPQHFEIIDNKWFHMLCSSHDQLAGDGGEKLHFTKGFLDRSLLD